MPVEKILDDSAMASGTHKGATSATVLNNPGADFKSCGVLVGSVCYNDTDASHGAITAVTEDTVTVTLTGGSDNQWEKGDKYSIYCTAAKNTVLGTILVDKRFGRKAASRAELTKDMLFPDDVDIDEYDRHVFGKGQPERRRGR